MTGKTNEAFELGGINHLALVCKDMARTVDFYSGVLGMPLVKTSGCRRCTSSTSGAGSTAAVTPS